MINPAVSNSENAEFNIQTRQQWLGFENAPLVSNIISWSF